MALQSSASSGDPLKLSEIKNEFTGGGNNFRSYLRAGGQVASHSNNSSIATSGTIRFSNFLSTSRNFESSMTTGDISSGPDTEIGYSAAAYGSMTRTTIGISKSATTQTTVIGLWETYTLRFDFFTGQLVETLNLRLRLSADVTGTWWNKIYLDGVELAARSAAATPNGVYSVSTSWEWGAVSYDSTGYSGQVWNYAGLNSLGSGVTTDVKITMT